jgi:hypothetical protein
MCTLIVVAYALQVFPVSLQAGQTSNGCVESIRRVLSSGQIKDGSSWRIFATIRNNGSCDRWRLGLEFFPAGTYAGSWRGAWGIPAEGHLSDNFTISARDEFEGSERAFSGVVGARVRKVVLTARDGTERLVRPMLPPKGLREKFVWLRDLRYLMYFYPLDSPMRRAKLLDSSGKVIYTARGLEGGFEGPF